MPKLATKEKISVNLDKLDLILVEPKKRDRLANALSYVELNGKKTYRIINPATFKEKIPAGWRRCNKCKNIVRGPNLSVCTVPGCNHVFKPKKEKYPNLRAIIQGKKPVTDKSQNFFSTIDAHRANKKNKSHSILNEIHVLEKVLTDLNKKQTYYLQRLKDKWEEMANTLS